MSLLGFHKKFRKACHSVLFSYTRKKDKFRNLKLVHANIPKAMESPVQWQFARNKSFRKRIHGLARERTYYFLSYRSKCLIRIWVLGLSISICISMFWHWIPYVQFSSLTAQKVMRNSTSDFLSLFRSKKRDILKRKNTSVSIRGMSMRKQRVSRTTFWIKRTIWPYSRKYTRSRFVDAKPFWIWFKLQNYSLNPSFFHQKNNWL